MQQQPNQDKDTSTTWSFLSGLLQEDVNVQPKLFHSAGGLLYPQFHFHCKILFFQLGGDHCYCYCSSAALQVSTVMCHLLPLQIQQCLVASFLS
mmetsp:Transcript_25234/g.57370  ORF Transcript_25234/g.57370 Transcript_25234/m.57370 type:complete len:94 (-) Transcript_25234:1171-1452(-)